MAVRNRNVGSLQWSERSGDKVRVTFCKHHDLRYRAELTMNEVEDIIDRARPIAKEIAQRAADQARRLGAL